MNFDVETEISIVIPCHNDKAHLVNSINILIEKLSCIGKKCEIIISDDGSTDGTKEINWSENIAGFSIKYIRNEKNKGKGRALKQGFQACRGNYIFFMDVDLPVDLNSIKNCIWALSKEKYDVVIGDRQHKDSKSIGSAAFRRHVVSKVFNLGVQIMALPGFKDTQCPMKGFTQNSLKKILPYSVVTSFAIDVELIYLAKRRQLRIKRIPVVWKDLRYKASILHLIFTLISCLKDVAMIRVRDMGLST